MLNVINVIRLSVLMLNVTHKPFKLNVIRLSVVMLIVVAPSKERQNLFLSRCDAETARSLKTI
jgi:hypothetical protein